MFSKFSALTLSLVLFAAIVFSPVARALNENGTAGHLYLLNNSVPVSSKIGPVGRGVHVVLVAGKLYLVTKATFFLAWLPLAAGLTAFHGAQAGAYLFANTRIDLGIRQTRRWRKFFRQLETIPGLSEIEVLTSNHYDIRGPMAVGEQSQGYVFVRTSQPIEYNTALEKSFGAPVEIKDPSQAYLTVKLSIGNSDVPEVWTLSLEDAFAGKIIDPETADSWAAKVQAFRQSRSFKEKYWNVTKDEEVVMNGTLTLPDGSQRELGPLFQAQSAYKFLGLEPFQKDIEKVKAAVTGKQDTKIGRIILKTRSFPGCEPAMAALAETN